MGDRGLLSSLGLKPTQAKAAKAGAKADTSAKPKAAPQPLPTFPSDPFKRIDAIADIINTLADKAQRDKLVRELRDLLIRIQPVMPDAEAKKAIDDAIRSLVGSGANALLKAVVEAAAGRSATPVPEPDKRSNVGPALKPLDTKDQIFKTPPLPLPFDTPKKKSNLFFRLKAPKTAAAGGTVRVNVQKPDGYVVNAKGAGRVVIMTFDDFDKNGANAERLISSESFRSSAPEDVELRTPVQPGRYVLAVWVGMAFEDHDTPELTLTK